MLSNFHTHTQFCDGRSTAEEMVEAAISAGFVSLGFSGHGYMDFDQSYCMMDTEGYNDEIERLKVKYKKDIQIYRGIEEDGFCYVDRDGFDYLLGSIHYLKVNGKYYPIDLGYDALMEGVNAINGGIEAAAESYFSSFVTYIKYRKPDIIGHFDLITKFDEKKRISLLK